MLVQNFGILQQKLPEIASVPDSISCNPTVLYFYADGTPKSQNYTVITSSGSWTAVETDYYSILQGFTGSGSGSGNAYVTVNYNDSLEDCQQCMIRYTRGTAHVDLTIYRDGMTNQCS